MAGLGGIGAELTTQRITGRCLYGGGGEETSTGLPEVLSPLDCCGEGGDGGGPMGRGKDGGGCIILCAFFVLCKAHTSEKLIVLL